MACMFMYAHDSDYNTYISCNMFVILVGNVPEIRSVVVYSPQDPLSTHAQNGCMCGSWLYGLVDK